MIHIKTQHFQSEVKKETLISYLQTKAHCGVDDTTYRFIGQAHVQSRALKKPAQANRSLKLYIGTCRLNTNDLLRVC